MSVQILPPLPQERPANTGLFFLSRACRGRVGFRDGATALRARTASGTCAGGCPAPAWFRRFVDVQDPEGAERALVSAVRGGATPRQLADMLFAAATDHRYLDGVHTSTS